MVTAIDSPLLGPLFASTKMRVLLSDNAVLQRMLDVEAALARAEAASNVIPKTAVPAIVRACDAKRFDLAALGTAAANAGNLAIPLVKALTAEVAKRDKDAARFVHWGATSQDIIDTATVLAVRHAVRLLERDLARAIRGFVSLAKKHRKTVMPGRTWLQHALPTVFGLKAAEYAAGLARARTRMLDAAEAAAVIQFGGAAGTLASLKTKGVTVARALARDLDLRVSDAPWHAHNDRLAALSAAIGIAVGTSGKIAADISLLMQSEVAEAFEPAAAGRGGSSTMPQKRNPVASAQILAAANLAPGLVASLLAGLPQEHERGVGGWQASWIALPQLFLVASGAFERLADTATGLEIDTERMRANLDISKGAIFAEAMQMALAEKMGRLEAHELLERVTRQAARENRHLRDVAAEVPEISGALDAKALNALFDPANYLGSADRFIESAVAAAQKSLK